MNLILFELRRMGEQFGAIILVSGGMIFLLAANSAGAHMDLLNKTAAWSMPVLWLLIAFSSVGSDREQMTLLAAMPVTPRRIFLTRLLVRLLPAVVLTAIFWSLIGFGGVWREVLTEAFPFNVISLRDFGGLILAGVAVLYFLQMSNLQGGMSIAKMFLLILALFTQPSARFFYQVFTPEYAFSLTCMQVAVLAFIGSWEAWISTYLNRKFRWRIVGLMFLPLAQLFVAAFLGVKP